MSLVAVSIDETLVERTTALGPFLALERVQSSWGASVALLVDGVTPVAAALATVEANELVVERCLVTGDAARRLASELQHRAALAGAATVRLLKGELPGFEEGVAPARRVERVIAIHQPNYLPWCGYFAKVKAADVFVFLDDVPMPGGSSYVTRTRVGGNAESQWLSVPTRHSIEEPLSLARIAEKTFGKKHLGTLRARYGRTPHFKALLAQLEPLYQGPPEFLAEFNAGLLHALFELLRLSTPTIRSRHLPTTNASGDRLVELVRRLGGTGYLSGKGGQNYQSEASFSAAGISLDVRPYQPSPYPQAGAAFEAGLSIVDALSFVGAEATAELLELPPKAPSS